MACNRETSTDGGSTSSANPVCRTPNNAPVPCCNSHCSLFGCAATMNFCSKCYSEHLLKEGANTFLTATARDPPVETQEDRPLERVKGVDEAADPQFCTGDSHQRVRNVSSECGAGVDTELADVFPAQILRSKESSSLHAKKMQASPSVSDLSTVFGLVDNTSSSLVDMSAGASDLPQQPIPSPLSLSSPCLRAPSPLRAVRQVESKLSLPPLAPARQQGTNRCLMCRKRVGLLGFKCRCGDIFCATHRYSDKHDCSFDYKAAGRAAIARENPVVKANKIDRI